jgi:uncharacterized protein
MTGLEHLEEGMRLSVKEVTTKDVNAAIGHFEEAVRQGVPDAHYHLGRIHLLGDTVEKDESRALDHHRVGASLGSAKCMVALGVQLTRMDSPDKDKEEAQRLFDSAYGPLLEEARDGDASAMYLVGRCHYDGLSVQPNLLKALEWLKNASDHGYSDALYMLGMILEKQDAERDHVMDLYTRAARMGHPYARYALGADALERKVWPKAVMYLEQAAKDGYVLAQHTLGVHYHDREPDKPMKAYKWFLEAAMRGHADAQYHVGLYNQTGKGVPQDLDSALFWYGKAARQMDKNALYHLALLMINRPDPDYPTIRTLLEQAAVRDHPHAMYNLGVMHQRGDGVGRDDLMAFRWYEKAALAGLAKAQYNLGMMYHNGLGVPPDEDKALEWWKKAADQGLEEARSLVVSIENGRVLNNSPWTS